MSATPTHDEAKQILSRFNNSHWNNDGAHARYSIPARPDHDDDIKLSTYIDNNIAIESSRDEWRAVAETLSEAGSVLRNMIRAQGHMGYSSHPGAMDCKFCKAETAMEEAINKLQALQQHHVGNQS